MIKNHSKNSLANQIAGILSAVPAQFDPDEEDLDGTGAKLVNFDEFNDGDNDDDLLSKFRKHNVNLLADVDTRYRGKKGCRRSLREETSSESSEVDSSKAEEPAEDGEGDSEGIDDADSEEDESDRASDDSENEGSLALSESAETNFQHMSETNVPEQVKKGMCVRNQMSIWESLLEMRIQMQKCLVAANKLPQKEHYKAMLTGSDSMDVKTKLKETRDSLGCVLDKFLALQNLVIRKFPETKNLENTSKRNKDDTLESEEEIPSDTDEDVEESDGGCEEELQPPKSKKRKLNDYEQDISELHHKYINYRNDTIEKWNTKTRLSITKNAGQTHSIVNQIEHILNDREKLKKRTQLKRSEYRILGEDAIETTNLESSEDNGDVKQVEEYNTEIFDDSDFYHQLLRELIEVKSTDIMDPVQLSRKWIQLQNLRSKMKRKIDTRATKGRKIRYAVHKKLVNFMAPLDSQLWTEKAKDVLYSSLFGKTQPK